MWGDDEGGFNFGDDEGGGGRRRYNEERPLRQGERRRDDRDDRGRDDRGDDRGRDDRGRDDRGGRDNDRGGGRGRGGGGGGGNRRYDDEEPPPLYSIHKAVVKSVQSYGAFVEIQGYRKHGLVHIGQLATHRVENVDSIVAEGNSVWVKLVRVGDDKKWSFSMKVVNQANGEDLDPENMEKGERGGLSRGPMGMDPNFMRDATQKAVCPKCGLTGHMAVDCYNQKGVSKYELIREDELPPAAPQAPASAPRKRKRSGSRSGSHDSDTKHREKKHKKHKHKDKDKKKKKKKKKKKEKKSKKDGSSSSSSSSEKKAGDTDAVRALKALAGM